MKNITIITSTRAEYGLLRPVIQKVAAAQDLQLQLVVTGAHFCARFGNTVQEIEADGLPIAARLPIFEEENPNEPVALTIARTITVFDGYFAAHRPDAVLLLGDRFEIFAVATAAAARHIPIAHISGGDVTLGAADEYYRHCITKMAALHFPSCAESAARLVRMGEAPETVFCVGGLGDENIRTLPKMTRQELCASTGFDLMQPFAIVTYHPETSAAAGDPAAQADALCAAMEAVPGVFWLITGSNADAGGAVCTAKMQAFAAAHPQRAGFINSLGLKRYLSAMQCAVLVVGNSSSGVVETPTFGVPTVNIGSRQAGRIICQNVLCCAAAAPAIEAALCRALTPEFSAVAHAAQSPYNGGDTSGKICRVLAQFDFAKPKTFYDGPVPEFNPTDLGLIDAAYPSIAEAVAAEAPDAALVCTAPLTHAAIISELLDNSLPVFTELNLVADGYEENMAKAKEKGVLLFLSSTMLYRRETQYIKQQVAAFGKPVHYIYHIGQYLPDWHPWENYKNFFVGNARTGGVREIFGIDLPWLLDAFGDVTHVTVQEDSISDLGLPYPDCVTLLLRHASGAQGVLAADVVSPKAVRNFECFGDGLHLFWEGNPKALYEFKNGDKQFVDTYTSFEHDNRYSDNIVENAYVDELTNFFACLRGEETSRWSFEKDLAAIRIMDKT